jgi:hypothetical protein
MSLVRSEKHDPVDYTPLTYLEGYPYPKPYPEPYIPSNRISASQSWDGLQRHHDSQLRNGQSSQDDARSSCSRSSRASKDGGDRPK